VWRLCVEGGMEGGGVLRAQGGGKGVAGRVAAQRARAGPWRSPHPPHPPPLPLRPPEVGEAAREGRDGDVNVEHPRAPQAQVAVLLGRQLKVAEACSPGGRAFRGSVRGVWERVACQARLPGGAAAAAAAAAAAGGVGAAASQAGSGALFAALFAARARRAGARAGGSPTCPDPRPPDGVEQRRGSEQRALAQHHGQAQRAKYLHRHEGGGGVGWSRAHMSLGAPCCQAAGLPDAHQSTQARAAGQRLRQRGAPRPRSSWRRGPPARCAPAASWAGRTAPGRCWGPAA
jgi:hypothetical protein